MIYKNYILYVCVCGQTNLPTKCDKFSAQQKMCHRSFALGGKKSAEYSDLLEDFFACKGLWTAESFLIFIFPIASQLTSMLLDIHILLMCVEGKWDESRTMDSLCHRTRKKRSLARAWMTLKDLEKRCHSFLVDVSLKYYNNAKS